MNFKAEMGSSRVLIIGATGYIGRHVARASLDLGHPTFLLARESTASSNAEKAQLLESFKASGAIILHVSSNLSAFYRHVMFLVGTIWVFAVLLRGIM